MYQQLIDDFISARDAIRQSDRGSDAGEWHPSSLSGCDRAAVYSYIGTPESDQRQIRNVRIMDRGTEMHEVVQSVVAAANPGFLPEVKIDHRGVKGSCDGLLPVADGNDLAARIPEFAPVYELQEYKSISPQAKRFMKGEPKPEHVIQSRVYHACLRGMGYVLTDLIRIVYFDRDDWSVDEYLVPAWTDAEAEDQLWAHLDNLNNHVEEGTLPERMPDDYWLCRYCPYFTTCKGAR